MQIYAPGFARRAPERKLRGKGACARAVDRLGVDFHPPADFSEPVDARLRDAAGGGGSDIQQVIAAFRRRVDEITDDRFGRLPIVIVGLVAPRIVHRHAAFPVDARQAARRDLLLRRAEIAAVLPVLSVEPLHALAALADAIVDDDVGFQSANVLIKVASVVFGPPVDPLAVEPQNRWIVGRDQLAELRLHVRDVLGFPAVAHFRLPVSSRRIFAGCIDVLRWMVPIHDRVVKAESDPFLFRFICQRAHRIFTVGRPIDDVVRARFAVEHREPVVVLRCDDDVLHAGGLGDAHPFGGVEPDRVELSGELFVPRPRNVRPRHDPLADLLGSVAVELAGRHGVEAPVDEHAEPSLAPPLHAPVAICPHFTRIGLRRTFASLTKTRDGEALNVKEGNADQRNNDGSH